MLENRSPELIDLIIFAVRLRMTTNVKYTCLLKFFCLYSLRLW